MKQSVLNLSTNHNTFINLKDILNKKSSTYSKREKLIMSIYKRVNHKLIDSKLTASEKHAILIQLSVDVLHKAHPNASEIDYSNYPI